MDFVKPRKSRSDRHHPIRKRDAGSIQSLKSSQFDMIIVDEAHKMSASQYGKTARYELGEVLSGISEHLLFLTATPHKGDPENFRLLLDLLEPGFFATSDMLKESIKNSENLLFLRRKKEDMRDFEGKPLFVQRRVQTPDVRLSDPEMGLYKDVSKYVKEQYNRALVSVKGRNVAFALLILQRRLASSTYALRRSLERRKQRLEEIQRTVDPVRMTRARQKISTERVEEMSENERWREEALWETLSVARNRKELEAEIRTLGRLIVKADYVIKQEAEAKLRHLKDTMTDLNKEFPNRKILIFTESKDTMGYLEEKIRFWGYAVNTIHGSMGLEERADAQEIFKKKTQVMVATEAAGEGINLQFCNLMINYDLPWNPNRLEQRMGRVHRYGQQYEVSVFNLVAANTREGEIMSRLIEKLDEIKSTMGNDMVFDVVNDVLEGIDLSQLLLDAATNARSQEDLLKEIDIKVDPEYIARIMSASEEGLAKKYMDTTRLKEMRTKARENRLSHVYTKALFEKAFTRAGGRMQERTDGFSKVMSIPYNIKTIASEDKFRKDYGSLQSSYSKITFDKEASLKNPKAQFVTFGHTLFESVLEWIDRKLTPQLHIGATFTDPNGKLDGYILFYEGEIKDGTGKVAGKRLFAYFIDSAGTVRVVPPAMLWDLGESDGTSGHGQVDLDRLKKQAESKTISSLKKYQEDLLKERERQGRIKQKYGIQSLRQLIFDLDNDLIDLQWRKNLGDDVDLVIRNKEARKQKYEESKKELAVMIQKEQRLIMSTPSFLSIVRVKPSVTSGGMDRDQVEEIGMRVAMEHEEKEGRTPENVSEENMGFDIKSRDKKGNFRYIEVKARTGTGIITITRNEWFQAQNLGEDFYLYVVWNAGNPNPQLRIIENPAKNLSVKQEVVICTVDPKEIDNKGVHA